MSKKLLFLSPYCGKIENALSKHSNLLIEELRKDYQLEIITSTEARLEINHEAVFYLDNWKVKELQRAREFIIKQSPRKIIFQYVPNMYNPRGGINLAFAKFISSIPREIKVIGFFHELYYPLLPELRSLILHPTHKYQLRNLLQRCDQVVTTTEEFGELIKRMTNNANLTILPAYSNITRVVEKESETTSSKRKIAFIGGLHPSKCIPEIIERLIKNISINERYEIHLFGVAKSQWQSSNTQNIIFHGHLEDIEFSQKLQQMDLVLAYFSDGLSTRRGSVMTALQHGIPVISSEPRLSHLYNFKCEGITLFSRELPQFLSSLEGYLLKKDLYSSEEFKEGIANYYQENFSAPHIIKRFKKDVLTSI